MVYKQSSRKKKNKKKREILDNICVLHYVIERDTEKLEGFDSVRIKKLEIGF